jgi:hypothetical protein
VSDFNNNNQETNKLSTTNKNWTEYKVKRRKEAVANFRLKTELDCLASHLRNIGMYECSECTICQVPQFHRGQGTSGMLP